MSLRGDFLGFDLTNPWIFSKLEEYCDQLWDVGWRRYSMRTILSVIRFDRDLKTGGSEITIDGVQVRVKINDHHSPYYARLLAYKRPRFENFFEYRRVEGERRGEVILFSDVPGEPDRPLGGPPASPPPRGTQLRFFNRRHGRWGGVWDVDSEAQLVDLTSTGDMETTITERDEGESLRLSTPPHEIFDEEAHDFFHDLPFARGVVLGKGTPLERVTLLALRWFGVLQGVGM